jgi:hypothetical protein
MKPTTILLIIVAAYFGGACGDASFTAAADPLAAMAIDAAPDSGLLPAAPALPDAGSIAVDGGFALALPEAGSDAGIGRDVAIDAALEASPIEATTEAAMAEASPPCLTDLSNVAVTDFRIRFTLTTTASGLTLALVGQRTGCTTTSVFWDVTLSSAGGIVASTGDGVSADSVFIEAGSAVNDGLPHEIVIVRSGGKLWYTLDGVVNSAMAADPYVIGRLPALTLGTSSCSGTTPLAGHGTLTNLCITSP